MEKFFVGCYSDKETSLPNAKGKGISLVSFDNERGLLKEEAVIESVDNPSYLFLNKQRNELYACSERFNEDGEISVIDLDTLNIKSTVSSKGLATCYVCYDEYKERLIWTNYLSGDIGSYNLSTKKEEYLKFSGKSINEERQEGPHPHFVEFYNDYILICDLGCDCIHILDRNSDGLSEIGKINTPKGYGPRHLVIRDDKLYVLCELIAKLLVYKFDEANNSWILEEEFNSEEDSLMDKAHPAAIKLFKGNIITTSNRFSDGLRQFIIKDDKVSILNTVRLNGENPRDFCFSKDENWVLVPYQDSDCIEIYPVDSDGKINKNLATVYNTGTPVCVIQY